MYQRTKRKLSHPTGTVGCNYPTMPSHYDDVIMTMLASQITSLTVVYSIVYSGVNQRKHQSSASLAFVREIHRGPVNFPHKWPVTRKIFPFDDVIMISASGTQVLNYPRGWRFVGFVMFSYDDVIKWKHFPHNWPFVSEIHRWIPLTKASDTELCCFLWSAPEQTVDWTIETPVIRDAIAPVMTSLQCSHMIFPYPLE